jgi:hypothetical protein
MFKDLPKYKITISDEYSDGEDLGISAIAFTSNPAIMVKGLAFSNDTTKKLVFNDDLKYRVAGPIMIPMEIYRCDESEYYVQFTEDEIEKIHQKFMKNIKNGDVFNLEHDNDFKVPAYVLESLLVDSENKRQMIKQEYNIDVPMGSSFLVTQVTDKEYYKTLIENEQIGFSIEGFLGLKFSEIINNNKQKIEQMNEEKSLLPAGEYKLEDGRVLVVAEDGSMEIKEMVEMGLEVTEEAKAGDPATQEVVSGETKVEMAEEVVDETKEVVEEEMAEEVVTEETVTEEVATPEVYSKEEVDAKFEELYKLIADMKAEEVMEEEVDAELEMVKKEQKMSVSQRLEAFVAFSKK